MYLLPYDLNLLRSISVREDLTRISNCADFAPYLRNFVKLPRWSRDGSMMAMVIMGNAKGIGSADTVQVISMGECTPTPDIIDNFPPPRFTPTEYAAVPALPNFGWDGLNLFSLATFIRNGGFGKLYIYNSDLKKAQGPLNLTGECCYRDPIFTPDGTQLLFAFQKYPGEDPTIFLYLIPYGTIGTGVTYTPLPIPPIDPKSAPMPAFRPAR
jgi:Tol biopolymer transport system component